MTSLDFYYCMKLNYIVYNFDPNKYKFENICNLVSTERKNLKINESDRIQDTIFKVCGTSLTIFYAICLLTGF